MNTLYLTAGLMLSLWLVWIGTNGPRRPPPDAGPVWRPRLS
jgi:hypothetical protein